MVSSIQQKSCLLCEIAPYFVHVNQNVRFAQIWFMGGKTTLVAV